MQVDAVKAKGKGKDGGKLGKDQGKNGKARRVLIGALQHPQPIAIPTRLAMSAERGQQLLDLLPRPYPTGDPGNEHVLGTLLLSLRRYDEAAHYAADTFSRVPNSMSAVLVARAATAAGDPTTGIAWLRQAFEINTSPDELAAAIDRAPELAPVQQYPDVIALRASLSR